MVIQKALRVPPPKKNASIKRAFTLAEILITLGIIGIIAAMTMPTLISNYKKKKNIVILQKAYSDIQRLFLEFQSDTGCYDYLNDCFPNENQFRDEFAKYLYNKRGFRDRFSNATQIEVNLLGQKTSQGNLWLIEYNPINSTTNTNKYNMLIAPNGLYILGLSAGVRDNNYQLRTNGKAFNPPNYFRAKIDIYTDPSKVNNVRDKNIRKVSTIGREIFYLYITSYGQIIPNGSTICKEGGSSGCGDIKNNPSLCDPNNDTQNLNNGSYCFGKIISDGWQIKY